jgi:polysaccharide deacetylase 2 family uncharacterized protein YibQ
MSDLSSPLGVKPPTHLHQRKSLGMIASTIMVLLAAALAVWMAVVDDPFGGEPVATVKIADLNTAINPADITTVGVKSGSGELLPRRMESPIEDDVPGEGPGADPNASVSQSADAERNVTGEVALSVSPDPELMEESSSGPIPRVSDDGRRPVDVYARPVPGFVGTAPKVIVIVGGLGLSQSGTQEAIRLLPPGVTLAFAPYGSSLDRWAARARQDGHELLLQVPLEPFDYPDNDPGPHTLLTSLDADKNIERLRWLMSRTTTYVGVIAYMGARFTAEGPALDPVLGELTSRGLMFVDDGTSSRSVAAATAKARATPFAKADLMIDAVATEGEIVGRLAQLEQIARTRGLAIGVASALPLSVKEIAAWAKTLEPRGITLVPITASLRVD